MDKVAGELQERIKRKKFKLAVVGLGYVGLPLAVEFAKSGIEVLGLEIDKDRLNHLYKKESYITDISDQQIRQVIENQSVKVKRENQNTQ